MAVVNFFVGWLRYHALQDLILLHGLKHISDNKIKMNN